MDESLKLLTDMNCAVIQFRGVYSAWSRQHGISYNEMLVLYIIRDHGFCTQKQICDSYILPRQTINHVISDMRRRGLLCVSPADCVGREKAFVLTQKGQSYAAPLMASLSRIETEAVEQIGRERVRAITESLETCNRALQAAMEAVGERDGGWQLRRKFAQT